MDMTGQEGSDLVERGPRCARLVVIGPIPPPVHGAAVVTGRLVDAVRERGAELRIIDTNDRPLLRRLGILVVGLLSLLRRPGRRRLYIAGAGGEMLWFQVAAVAVARAVRMPTTFHHHNFAPLVQRSLPMRLVVRIGGSKLVHVVQGNAMASLLRDGFCADVKVMVCSNAAHMHEGRPVGARPRTVEDEVVLGLLSNLTVEKGALEAIEVLRRGLDRGMSLVLRLAGPADAVVRPAIETARADLGDRVEWVGPVPVEEVDDFYRGLDLFLFPSTYSLETEGMVILEAARNGVPAVAFDVGCVAETVGSSGTVVSVDGSFVDAALDVAVRLGPEPNRDRIRQAFLDRRGGAKQVWDDLIDSLVAPR